jgi:hypothetical protein
MSRSITSVSLGLWLGSLRDCDDLVLCDGVLILYAPGWYDCGSRVSGELLDGVITPRPGVYPTVAAALARAPIL